MSFLLHTKEYAESANVIPSRDIKDFFKKPPFSKDVLAEFSNLYALDKHSQLLAQWSEMGGYKGIAYALHTSHNHGLSENDLTPEAIQIREDTFGFNRIPKKPSKTFFRLMWDALQDPMLIVLIVAGGVNIPLGVIAHGAMGFTDGAAVLLAVAIVVVVTALNDYQKELQFRAMEAKSNNKSCAVIRNDAKLEMKHAELLVGDLVHIPQGAEIPCDGIVVRAENCKVTEAALTGESTALKKDVFNNPFVIKGSNVVEGEAFIVATGVGESTSYGKLMAGLLGNRRKMKEAEARGEEYNPEEDGQDEVCCPVICGGDDEDDDKTPLQRKLDTLAEQVGFLGTMAAFLLFEFGLLGEYGKKHPDEFVLALVIWMSITLIPIGYFYMRLSGRWERSMSKAIGEYLCPTSDDDKEAQEQQDAIEEAERRRRAFEEGDDPDDDYDAFEDPRLWAILYCVIFWLVCMDIHLFVVDPLVEEAMHYFILAVTIIVVAVPEGLPLAVTISLAYSMKKMYKDKNFVRKLAACETMGNATTICSDKTGTLTTNMMRVVALYDGQRVIDEKTIDKESLEHNLGEVVGRDYAELLGCSISCNSIAVEKTVPDENNPPEDEDDHQKWEMDLERYKVQGVLTQNETNQTESACLLFTMLKLGEKDYYIDARKQYPLRKNYPFDSKLKFSCVFVEHDEEKQLYRLYIKGAAERIVKASTHRAASTGGNSLYDCELVDFTEDDKVKANEHTQGFTNIGLRCIGFGYREVQYDDIEWVKDPATNEMQPAATFIPNEKVIFLGVVGIKDKVRKEVPGAVLDCQGAGIVVRMVTGDHIDTARFIAKECNILTNPEQLTFTGQQFQEQVLSLPEGAKKKEIMNKIRVIARARPRDKEDMVNWYKKYNGDVVAVTGDGANDALALQEAHVGLAMKIQGTDVAQEASDIIIMDDNFASIVKTVQWGRSVYDNIRKFVQFQLTVNYVALTLSLIGVIVPTLEMPLTAVQLLWVNLIMDTMAALALATEMPTPELLNRAPYDRSTHLISPVMWRFVAVHGTIQLVILLIIMAIGEDFFDITAPGNFDYNDTSEINRKLATIVFNTFVWFQIFNEINARKVNGEWNVFEKFFENSMFGVILVFTMLCQFAMVQFGGEWANTKPLDGKQWLFCIVVGLASFPIGQLVLWFPVNETFGQLDVQAEWFRNDLEFMGRTTKKTAKTVD